MSAIITVMRKELRGLFQSPVAMIFLGVFLVATLFLFFTGARFFARNLADVRPLFEWLPVMLIFLVAAVTMRMWAEERKMGTLELLRTLPLQTHHLVVGKFAASVGLVKVALLLTLPLPIMVSTLGDLDWGPVIGGYVGAVLLGATYSAVGLAISSRTDNQVVALMLTIVVCGALYLVGAPTVVSLVDRDTADILRSIGTGARFESVARGVIDLRDFVYYLGVTCVALAFNVLALEADRVDAGSATGRTTLRRLRLGAALVAANAVAAVAWLSPVTATRVDLTRDREYSLSGVTKEAVRALPEPLYIEGYFSERTHPLLAPLVPQVRDLLAEYEIVGRGNVHVSFADPNADEELQVRLQEDFGVRSMPFRVADRSQQAVVNAYFHIVVRYGDQYTVLSFEDLIEVRFGESDFDARLRNLEYDVTRAIRRVTQDFQTIESVLAAMPSTAKITLVASPASVPADLAPVVETIRAVATELAGKSTKLEFAEVDPTGNQALQAELAERYNIEPLAVDIFATETFYLDVVVEMGDRAERVVPRGELSEAEARSALEASIRRLTPGQLTTVALLTREEGQPDPNIPPQFQPPLDQPDYRFIEQLLTERFQVERTTLPRGEVPGNVDVLVVAKPGELTDEQRYAVDQYLMRGGAVIALAGRYEVKPSQQGLEAAPVVGDIADLLATWGVTVGEGLVFDPQNAAFPIPVQEQRGGVVLQRMEFMDYPMFVDIRADGFDRSHAGLSGLGNLTTPWASPLTVNAPDGVTSSVLLRSSERSWVQRDPEINPDMNRYPVSGFPSETTGVDRHPVAVALTGTFPSHYATRPAPGFDPGEGSGDGTGRTIKKSSPEARLAVVGSVELVSDLILSLAQQPGGEVHRSNVQLVENLLDWAVEDTALLEIRSSGAFARTLKPLEDEQRARWEYGQLALAVALVLALSLIPLYRRRTTVPFASGNSPKVSA